MSGFFDNISYEDADRIDRLAKLTFELRDNRKALLKHYGMEDEAEMLANIQSGALPEHPAYDHYLSARILDEAREALRTEIAAALAEVKRA